MNPHGYIDGYDALVAFERIAATLAAHSDILDAHAEAIAELQAEVVALNA